MPSGWCLFLINVGIESIGPGLYSEITAIRSSKSFGTRLVRTFVIPCDSNWKTPTVSPEAKRLKVFSSSRGISFTLKFGSKRWTAFSQLSITVRVRKPKKSIFKRPNSSMVVIVNWVTICPSLLCNGTYSTTGLSVITTPAAWVEAFLGIPSTCEARSISSLVFSSPSYNFFNSGDIFRALAIVILSSLGTSFAVLSTCP